MDSTERKFINYIGQSTLGERQLKIYDNINYTEINWNRMLELTELHKFNSLIYSSLIRDNSLNIIDKDNQQKLLDRCNISQINDADFLEYFFKIINNFQAEEIPVIAVKGLFEKELYPFEKYRQINEIQLLIKRNDKEDVKKILSKYGYAFRYSIDGNSLIFTHDEYYPIEVHTSFYKLSNNSSMLGKLQRDVWCNCVEKTFDNITLLSLCDEDRILYLAMNMANNFKDYGLRLVDICDFTLLLNSIESNLNWDSFFIKTSMCEIDKFLLVLFIICKELFNINIPKELDIKNAYNEKYINTLLTQIINPNFSDDKLTKYFISKFNNTKFNNILVSLKGFIKKSSTPATTEEIINWLNLH